ncbi:YeeE/YedE family protein [Candidatus Igneacidithiobacillus taiwanensis]|uniref:YeeE/YedE family protein n=1 Tax=Candidatus Igneacidithiobacillus taiwanensis TaxID=1945924 RepID=UPI002898774D|nr:YeeE/YedE family protein [Candidatus Igneacidithiobacillus taiwanensis]
MQLVSALLIGLLFGVGLNVGGMTEPTRIIGFFDVFGTWDPSLAFVMAGALSVGLLAFPFLVRHGKTVLGEKMSVPTRRDITPSLVIGSLLFGSGWGLSGYCPGPALAAIGTLDTEVLLFFAAMLLGMVFHLSWERYQSRRLQPKQSAS